MTTIITRLSTSTSSTSSPQQATDQLKPGDCLTGSNLGLGTNSQWPDSVTVVPCTKRHIAEVFFTGNVWPQSQKYPGDKALFNQAVNRCNVAFTAYDGIMNDNSEFTFDFIGPAASDWASGDRWLACVAYDATSKYPGGAPVSYSIKGSHR